VGQLSLSRAFGGRDVAETAARTWTQRHPDLPRPAAAHLLKTHPNSVVVKLEGALADGSPIVAKLAPRDAIAAETRLYTEVLRSLPIAVPEYYGTASGEHGDWLFLSYIDGEPYNSSLKEHRQFAGRYAGSLHYLSARDGLGRGLPRRDADFFGEQLDSAWSAIRSGISNSAVSPEGQSTLQAFLGQLQLLKDRWDRIERHLQSMPHAVVHGDFVSKNLTVRNHEGSQELVVMDWEMAGWGPIATDLGWLDLEAYRAALGTAWPELDKTALQDLSSCSRVFRTVSATCWEAPGLTSGYPEKSIHRVRMYLEWLYDSLANAPWTTGGDT
jgi:hypothetical protein